MPRQTDREERFTFSPAAVAAAEGVEAEVEVTLAGTFRHGRISVDNRTIPLNSGGSGHATVRLFPPDVDVEVLTAAPAPCEFAFTVTINGTEKEGKGDAEGGKQTHNFRFPFKAFDL